MTRPESVLPLGVYIHFPYCPQKCPYCDFAVRVERVIPQARYTDAIVAELRRRAPEYRQGPERRVVSIYLGGGTPSLWEPDCVARVLHEVREALPVLERAEVTLEANPESAGRALLGAFRDAGVTRLSIGAQSFEPQQLVALGRWHSAAQAEGATAAAREAGFDNLSLDLIHGGAGQTAHRVRQSDPCISTTRRLPARWLRPMGPPERGWASSSRSPASTCGWSSRARRSSCCSPSAPSMPLAA